MPIYCVRAVISVMKVRQKREPRREEQLTQDQEELIVSAETLRNQCHLNLHERSAVLSEIVAPVKIHAAKLSKLYKKHGVTYKTVVRKSQNQRRYPAERMRELIQQTLERLE